MSLFRRNAPVTNCATVEARREAVISAGIIDQLTDSPKERLLRISLEVSDPRNAF